MPKNWLPSVCRGVAPGRVRGLYLPLAWALAFAPPVARAADGDDARSLLRQCLKTQERTNQVSMHIVTVAKLDTWDGQPKDQRAELDFRRDGDLLDVVTSHLFRDQAGQQIFRFHCVVNADYSLEWRHGEGAAGPAGAVNLLGPAYSADSPTFLFQDRITKGSTGLALDGYMPETDWRRITEHLLQAEDVHVRGDDRLGGVTCKVVTGHTAFGEVTLWISPGEGHVVRKSVYTKGPDDPPEPGHLDTKGYIFEAGRQSWTFVVDGVEVEKVGDTFVPSKGHARETLEQQGRPRKVIDYDYTRTNISTGPPDRAGGLFTMTDLPEGSQIEGRDRDGLRFVTFWRGGKFGGPDEGEPAPAESSLDWLSNPGQGHTTARVLARFALVGLACFLIYRFRRRRTRGVTVRGRHSP
jgi:hypothetical protein